MSILGGPSYLSREQLRSMPRQQLEDLVLKLQDENILLRQRVAQLERRMEALEARLHQNSRNSHKPPSSDGYTKPAPKSLREPSDRSSGGQPAHEGRSLKAVARPDRQIIHPLHRCSCGRSLVHQRVRGYDRRQVFDLPEVRLEVTEHQAEVKRCPDCGQDMTAPFPALVRAPVQYGPRVQAHLVYWRTQQMIPLDRISQMTEDFWGQAVSAAAIQDATIRAQERLEPFEAALRQAILDEDQLNADETGLRVNQKLHWLHVLSSPRLTWYGVHPRRGGEAMNDFGLLPLYQGRLIHDYFPPYTDYGQEHAFCNSHHGRELTATHEQSGQHWPLHLYQLLLGAYERVRARHTPLPADERRFWIQGYRDLLAQGQAANSPEPLWHPPRGRPAHSKIHNLLDRLKTHERQALAFLWDPTVPFTNNQAERDLRMMKLQQKISGCFRTLAGAQRFARIRTYLSTARKQGHNVFAAITHALAEHPFLPLPTIA